MSRTGELGRKWPWAKDPASNDISRGWCRLMGLTAITLFTACLLTVRNERVLRAFTTRQADNTQRAAAGPPATHPATAPHNTHRPHRRAALTTTPAFPAHTHPAALSHHSRRHRKGPAMRSATQTSTPKIIPARKAPIPTQSAPDSHNVRPKREDKTRSNVKTSWWAQPGSNQRPLACKAIPSQRCTHQQKPRPPHTENPKSDGSLK